MGTDRKEFYRNIFSRVNSKIVTEVYSNVQTVGFAFIKIDI